MRKYLSLVAYILIVSIISAYSVSVLAQESTSNSDITPVNSVAANNVKIISDFNASVDSNKNYAVNLEYDGQKRITKVIAKSSLTTEILEVSYNVNGAYSTSKTTDELPATSKITPSSSMISTNIQLMSSSSNYDKKMSDGAVKSRISEAQSLWDSANIDGNDSVKDRAHLEAEIARADYCVVYPKSSFAFAFLESGGLSNDTAFRRQISYTEPQMYGSDIMAIQRALVSCGYLEATDIAFEQYGYFGPTTQAAVNEYQHNVVGINPTGTVANKTISKLFSSESSNNQSQVSFGGLNRINVFRMKHDYVANMTALQLNVSGTTVWKDPNTYIAGAGVKGNGGRADIIRDWGGTKAVWEVKPDSYYGTSYLTGVQIESYRTASMLPENASRPYCPITYLGSDITPFYIPWGPGYSVYVSSAPMLGIKYAGVVYYRDSKNGISVFVPVPAPATEPRPEVDYNRITWPEPQTVLNGVLAAGAVVAAYYIIKGAIAILGAPETGGASLLLLCF